MPAQHCCDVSLPVRVLRGLPTGVCPLLLADANSRHAGADMASGAPSRLHGACILLPLPVQVQSVMADSLRRWLSLCEGSCLLQAAACQSSSLRQVAVSEIPFKLQVGGKVDKRELHALTATAVATAVEAYKEQVLLAEHDRDKYSGLALRFK